MTAHTPEPDITEQAQPVYMPEIIEHLNDADQFDIGIGKNLRRLRRMRGLVLREVADPVGLRFQQIQKYECGANELSLYNYLRICVALSCDASAMLGFVGVYQYLAMPAACTDKQSFYERLGRELYRERRAQRLTQSDVGEVLGVPFQQIQKYESGKNKIGMRRYFNVARLCGLTPDQALFMAVSAFNEAKRDVIYVGSDKHRGYKF